MGLVAVNDLEEGMVTACNIKDRNGRMLLPAGTELTSKHMLIFRTWGVAQVAIVEPEQEAQVAKTQDELDDEELAAAEESLKPYYRLCGLEHPILRELLRQAALRRLKHGLL